MRTDKEPTRHSITRRRFLQAATVAASGVAGLASPACRNLRITAHDYSPLAAQARVTILHASSYDGNLSDLLRQGMKNHSLNVQGKRVVLKPNLVEYHTAHKINTNPLLVAAALDCFRSMGAKEVIIA